MAHLRNIWSDYNPHVTSETNYQRRFSVNVWCSVVGINLIRPYVLNYRLSDEAYQYFLQNELSWLLEDVPAALKRTGMYIQHDGASTHFDRHVTKHNEAFPIRWIGQGRLITRPAKSSNSNPLDFFIRGHIVINV